MRAAAKNPTADDKRVASMGEYADVWRRAMVEGMGAAADVCHEFEQWRAVQSIKAEMRRRFGALAKEEIERRGL